ncbi:MAG: DUF1566 domain-containing protein [Desulfobacteraceae bacterium]|nr:MAG: DUF1566 domain-containing protein [Desulfobacteraceae bacterium]
MQSIIFRITLSITLLLTIAVASAHAATERGLEIKNKNDLSHKSGKLGAYRALVIGINNYQDKKIPALKTAVHDAREFARLLQTRYGFKVTLLLDQQATRQAIMEKMRDLAANTSPDESVLIYYAGHGDVDRVLNAGWWIPSDAIGGIPATYLDNDYVKRVMQGMNARHVLLVSDSCYSGTLFGESRTLPSVIDDRYYMNLYNEKSRWGITSGNKTPVSDSGSEGHSIFAYQLIKTLENNDKPYITTQEIYSRIAPIIANNSEQQPLCSPVRDTGDQGGGFVFVTATTPSSLKKSSQRPESDDLLRLREFLEQEKQELEQEKQELERLKALDAEREKLAAERRKLEAEKQKLVMGPRSSSVESKAKAGEIEIARAKADAIAKSEEIERAKAAQTAKARAEAEERARNEAAAKAKADADAIARAEAKKHESKIETAALDPAIVSPKIVTSDSRFEKLASGVVRDTKSGLEWYAGPDKNTGSNDASHWAVGLRVDGGGWRMPTLEELKGLYHKGAGSRNMTPLLETTGWWVWSGDKKTAGGGAWPQPPALDFDKGTEDITYPENPHFRRGFAVRSMTKTATAALDAAVVSSKIVAFDGRFEKLASGVVRDTKSGLEWYAGPDKNTSWDDANVWTAALKIDGGGWRIPTINELKGLYQKGAGSRNMTAPLETTGWLIWSIPTGSLGAAFLDFGNGLEDNSYRNEPIYKRGFAVRSKAKTSTAAIDPTGVSSKIIASDGRFEKFTNGVVRDSQSGLEWYAGPDKDTDWNDAKNWVAGLKIDGGGWRMPTINELKGLYQKGAGSRNMSPLLETTGWWVWSGETIGVGSHGLGAGALALDFSDGRELKDGRDNSKHKRMLAVRSRK